MRRSPAVVLGAVAVPLTLAIGGVAQAAPPDGDGATEALAGFEALAQREGITLVDPVCVPTADELVYVCYALTDAGSPFVAQTSVGDDIDDWEILNQPDPAVPPGSSPPQASAEPNVPPAAAQPPAFEPLSFFADLFSADEAKIDGALTLVRPGSPADAYVQFQRQHVATVRANGSNAERAYVYLTAESVRVCVTPEQCAEITDLETEGNQLVTFAVDGNDIGPRLGRPGDPVMVGTTAIRLAAAYQTVTGSQLAAYLSISSDSGDQVELSTAVYVAPDGTQTPVDLSATIGATDGFMKSGEVLLSFPDAAPGGEIRFLIHPIDGSTPLAAIVAVEAFTTAD